MQQLIANSVDIARLDAGERAKVLSMLNRLERDLAALMGSRVLSEMGRAQTAALLKEVTALIQETYTEVNLDIAATLQGLAPIEVQATTKAIEGALNITLGSTGKLSQTYLEKLASNVLVDGSPVKTWFSRQAGDVAFRFAAELRKGLLAGETNQQIIARVVGTPDVPGVLPIARKNAAALVQTSVATVSNEARLALYRKNADVVKGVEYSATLDGHTCGRCAVRDHTWWDLDGVPQDGNTLPFEAPPLHMNCRCTTSPRLKLFSEQGIDLPDLPVYGGRRAASGGPVKRDTNFEMWFRSRTPEQQDEQFGAGKAALFRAGKINLRDMLDQSGNPLTLAELKARYD